jgi:hypothetical protein
MQWDLSNPYLSATTFMWELSRYNVSTATPTWLIPISRAYRRLRNAFTVITISSPSIHGYRRNTAILIPIVRHHGKRSTTLPSMFSSTTNGTSTKKWPARSVMARWKTNIVCRLKTGVWVCASNATRKKVPMLTAGWHVTVERRSECVYRRN